MTRHVILVGVRRLIRLMLLLTCVAGALKATAFAHEAPKDGNGCHFSESEGYHCH